MSQVKDKEDSLKDLLQNLVDCEQEKRVESLVTLRRYHCKALEEGDAADQICIAIFYSYWMSENIVQFVQLMIEEGSVEYLQRLMYAVALKWSVIDRLRFNKYVYFVEQVIEMYSEDEDVISEIMRRAILHNDVAFNLLLVDKMSNAASSALIVDMLAKTTDKAVITRVTAKLRIIDEDQLKGLKELAKARLDDKSLTARHVKSMYIVINYKRSKQHEEMHVPVVLRHSNATKQKKRQKKRAQRRNKKRGNKKRAKT